MSKTVLMVLTSHTQFGENRKTGVWLEEFALPYQQFNDESFDVVVASIQGGRVLYDPQSNPSAEQAVEWKEALAAMESSYRVSDIDPTEMDAIFLPGGHGTMFDFPESNHLRNIIEHFAHSEKPIAAICHGPAALVNVQLTDGTPLVQGKELTCFTNEEEYSINLEKEMPFLLESRLKELGATFNRGSAWSDNVVVDGNLLTGQNPMSSKSLAEALVNLLKLYY